MVSVGQWCAGRPNGRPVKVPKLEQAENGTKRVAALVLAIGAIAGGAAYLLAGHFLPRAEAAQTYVTKDQLGTIDAKLDLIIQLHGGALARPAPAPVEVTP